MGPSAEESAIREKALTHGTGRRAGPYSKATDEADVWVLAKNEFRSFEFRTHLTFFSPKVAFLTSNFLNKIQGDIN
jgi:hypothetical protein